jgi:hypothetical protein
MGFVMNHTDLIEIEGKIDQIDLGFELGIIQRSVDGWHYARLADRSSDDSDYVELELGSPLQTRLIAECLLTDPDGQPDIHVHGNISSVELRVWLIPIVAKWGEVQAYLNGELVQF